MVYLHLLGSTSPNLAMVNRSTATPVSNELLMSIAEASGQRIQGRAATGRASQASRNNSSSSKLHGGMGGGVGNEADQAIYQHHPVQVVCRPP